MQPENIVKGFVQRAVDAADGTTNDVKNSDSAGDCVNDAAQLLKQTKKAFEENSITPQQATEVFKHLADLNVKDSESEDRAKRLHHVRALAHTGLARCAIAQGDPAAARLVLQVFQERAFSEFADHPEVKSALAITRIAEDSRRVNDADDLDVLTRKCDADELSSDEHLNLAKALLASGQHKDAIEEALSLMKKDLSFKQQTKEILLAVFDVLGPKSEITIRARRRMTNILL